MDQDAAHLVGQSLYTSRQILETEFYNAKPSWVAEAAFALLMVSMKDALQILAKSNLRVSFTDDIPVGDITDLISNMRNAICHVGSPLRHMDEYNNTLSFGVAIGAAGLISGPDYELSNPYADDVAFFYGKHRVFLKRHCHRACKEAFNRTKTKAQAEGWWWPFD